MNTVNIRLYDIFRKDLNLPDVKAKELVEIIQESARVEIAPVVDGVATKAFVQSEIASTKSFVQSEIANLRLELTKEIKDGKYDTIKWMFTFWVGTIGIALPFYFLKK